MTSSSEGPTVDLCPDTVEYLQRWRLASQFMMEQEQVQQNIFRTRLSSAPPADKQDAAEKLPANGLDTLVSSRETNIEKKIGKSRSVVRRTLSLHVARRHSEKPNQATGTKEAHKGESVFYQINSK